MKSIVACGVLALACAAEATVIRFTFGGTIDQITGPVTSPIQLGDPFTISYTFESTTPDFNPFPGIGEYLGALIKVDGQIGVVPVHYTLGNIEVRNDTALGDVYSVLSGAATSDITFYLADFGSVAFTSDELPQTLQLAAFDVRRMTLTKYLSSVTSSEVSGSITTFSSAVVCYADCNEDSGLTIADFACFQARFAAGDPWADCTQSGGLTIADFACFQSAFALGCP